MPAPGDSSFERSYWTEDSQYRKFENYAAGLAALRAWSEGFLRLAGPELPAPGRNVDAGCGHGALVHALLESGWDAHGFDASRWIVEQARLEAPALAERFAVGELADIPFPGSFNLITCSEVLEHVPDPVASLRSLGARLTTGGCLIATTPNRRPLMPWPDPLASDPTHVNVHEPAWWRRAIEASGLRARRVTTFIAVPLLWRLTPRLSRWLLLGPRLGPSVLIVAER